MKNSLAKNALRALLLYTATVIIFGVFLYPVISMTEGNVSNWLPVYSLAIFMFFLLLFYNELWAMAVEDKRQQGGQKSSYPFKGFLIGFLGFLPYIVLALAYPLIHLTGVWEVNLKRLILHTLLGPEFFIIKWGGKTVLAYVAAVVTVPLVCGLSYLAGFYGIRIRRAVKKDANPKGNEAKAFKKSPWNPTANTTNTKK